MVIKNKKADMTVKAVIGWIVLILSFAIILVFVIVYPWGSNINSDTCHTTIVLRASADFKLKDFSGDIPLKCKTQKICLKSSFLGGCSDLKTSFLGKDVQNMPAKTKDEALDSIADTMYSDFSMTGKGLLNFMPRKWLSTKDNYCFISSRIAAQDPNGLSGITYNDLFRKLEQKKTAEGKSYLYEMYGANTVENLIGSSTPSFKDSLSKQIDFSKDQMIVIQFVQPANWAPLAGLISGTSAAITVVAGAAAIGLSAGILTPVVVGVAWGAVVAAEGNTDKSDPSHYKYVPPNLYEYTPKAIAYLKCDSIETLA